MMAAVLRLSLENQNYDVVGVTESAEATIALLNEKEVDLVLLDIHLKGSRNGLSVARTIRSQYNLPFIFTTSSSSEEMMSRAKEFEPNGYLIKPLGIKEIHPAIEMAMSNFLAVQRTKGTHFSFTGFAKNLFLRTDSKLVKIREKEILWIEAKGDYVVFNTEEKNLIVHSTLKKVESKLSKNQFMKVHRSFIVNIDMIEDIEDFYLQIKNKIIPISRAQRKTLLSRIELA